MDWQHLKTKVDAGAEFVITQLFFSNRDYFEFREFLARLGVCVPIVPGIIPILSGSQIKRFTDLCGAKIPAPLALSPRENRTPPPARRRDAGEC